MINVHQEDSGITMNERLKANIESKLKATLPSAEWEKLQSYCHTETLKKKDILLREGQFCNQLYFVEKGLLYAYQVTDTFEKQVTQIAYEDFWISDLYSFFSGKPAISAIEALEPSTIVVISKANFEKACLDIPILERFFRILFQNAYVSNQQKLLQSMVEDATTRYRLLLERHPEIPQRVPQYVLASFLGIKPQSLSRIRKNMSNK